MEIIAVTVLVEKIGGFPVVWASAGAWRLVAGPLRRPLLKTLRFGDCGGGVARGFAI